MTTTAAGSEVPIRPHAIIVSDDADLRQFLGEGLVVAGFWTSVVASGIQAIEVFRLRSFDLGIVDAQLAGLGAAEVMRRLRGGPEPWAWLTDVPVVAVAEDAAAADHLKDAPFDAVFVAPIDLDDLAVALMRLVRVWRAAHPARPLSDASPAQRRQGA